MTNHLPTLLHLCHIGFYAEYKIKNSHEKLRRKITEADSSLKQMRYCKSCHIMSNERQKNWRKIQLFSSIMLMQLMILHKNFECLHFVLEKALLSSRLHAQCSTSIKTVRFIRIEIKTHHLNNNDDNIIKWNECAVREKQNLNS